MIVRLAIARAAVKGAAGDPDRRPALLEALKETEETAAALADLYETRTLPELPGNEGTDAGKYFEGCREMSRECRKIKRKDRHHDGPLQSYSSSFLTIRQPHSGQNTRPKDLPPP